MTEIKRFLSIFFFFPAAVMELQKSRFAQVGKINQNLSDLILGPQHNGIRKVVKFLKRCAQGKLIEWKSSRSTPET